MLQPHNPSGTDSASAGALNAIWTRARDRLAEHLGNDPMALDVLARWDRWGADLLVAVEQLYPDASLPERLVDLITEGHEGRSEPLRDRDRHRLLEPDWFQRADAIGYAAYAHRFAGDLKGVARRIDYLQELGVTYLHLMPLLETRPGTNDGGYAVMDYRRIRPDVGTMEDLSDLTSQLHAAGMSLTLDLVVNHVAREHAWAAAARAGDAHHRDYFLTFADRTEPDLYERDLPEVFPAFAPGNFTWDEDLQRWVWTTFNSWQWDLNWANPDVLCEFVGIILNLANRGVDCLRIDAIVFLWKRLGTNCQNQPEVHVITQILRAVVRIAAPSVIFKAEAIVSPRDLVAYLGVGEHAGRISDLAYHNSLMVQIWSALATRDVRLLEVALSRFRDLPTSTAWATYLRCHDDIGWAISDEDAAEVGWSGRQHRSFLSDFYVGNHPTSFANGVTFQANPITGDRRISGSAASLAGVGRATDAQGLQMAVDRLLCAHAIVLGFGGIPLIYMGDELALLNDEDYAKDPEHASDNRWIHRPEMPWHLAEQHGLAGQASGMVYAGLRNLIRARKSHESLHASVPTRVAATSSAHVICFVRKHPAGDLVQVYNVADFPVVVPASDIGRHVPGADHDLLTGRTVSSSDGVYELPPYAALWLTRPPAGARGAG